MNVTRFSVCGYYLFILSRDYYNTCVLFVPTINDNYYIVTGFHLKPEPLTNKPI